MTLSVGPKLGLLVHGAQGEPHYDELTRQWRALDTLIQCTVISMTVATPPGSPADGDTYIVAASPTGAWSGHATHIARWSAVLGAWEFFVPKKGWKAHNSADSKDYNFNNTSWEVALSGGTIIPVVTVSGASLTATAANSGNYTRFTDAAAKTYTFDSAQSYDVGAEYHARNVGAGNLTLTAAGSFTLNPPAGGTLVVPQGGTVTIKIVGAAEADIMGYTEAAP